MAALLAAYRARVTTVESDAHVATVAATRLTGYKGITTVHGDAVQDHDLGGGFDAVHAGLAVPAGYRPSGSPRSGPGPYRRPLRRPLVPHRPDPSRPRGRRERHRTFQPHRGQFHVGARAAAPLAGACPGRRAGVGVAGGPARGTAIPGRPLGHPPAPARRHL
ncbi:hypothetical protein [Streptomyces clavuligerus]|uniref:hypothetical protein n=1 Tax=Streptomyces clavuligerus TaxID=1901 RepID=UPI0002EC1FB4|nr:hypothetical protein [Streptomyces clavuligerus]